MSVILVAVSGCTGGTVQERPAIGVAHGSDCAVTSSAAPGGVPGIDVEGSGQGAQVWALPFEELPLPTAREVKIVWRMTGKGPLQISARHPDGTVVAAKWGPQPHGGSNWDRPGDEWGTSFVFGRAGCWTVNLVRDAGSGQVRLPVR